MGLKCLHIFFYLIDQKCMKFGCYVTLNDSIMTGLIIQHIGPCWNNCFTLVISKLRT
jgi:hypothetical protein